MLQSLLTLLNYPILYLITLLCLLLPACVHAKSLQSCLTLFDSMDYSSPGSSVYGILQARILEWTTMPSSRGSSQPTVEPMSLPSPALAGGFFTTNTTWEALMQKPLEDSCPGIPSSPASLCLLINPGASRVFSQLGLSPLSSNL